MNKVIYATIVFFVILGLMFFSYIVHETIHVYQMKGAEAVCLAVGMQINDSLQSGYLIMFTEFNIDEYDNLEEYQTMREQSEKIVALLLDSLELISGMVLGWMLGVLFLLHFKRKKK